MVILPAIDLKDGQCVRLRQGRAEDVTVYGSDPAAQARILDALWQVVQPGGKLLYATCSVFPAENGQQIERFLARRPQAGRCHEEQLLPTAEHDGFYYCLLEKRA